MIDLLTVHQVAELLQHPDPQSRAGAAKVARLVGRGLPFIAGTRPRLYLRHQVLAWLETQTTSPAPTPAKPEPPRRARHRAAVGGLDALIAERRGRA